MRLERAYVVAADTGSFPADEALGVDGRLSPGATRLAVLAGVHDAFAWAQRLMTAMLGWAPDDDVIRRDAGRFAAAPGELELQVDAGKVPTTGGWRDVKLAAVARRAVGVAALLADGKPGVDRWIAGRFAELPEGCDGEPLRSLSAYLAAHPTRLNDADRLARGRSIGSGLVEGAIKQLVNRRMKRTGARWRVEHVGPLVELVALADQPEWHHLWAA